MLAKTAARTGAKTDARGKSGRCNHSHDNEHDGNGPCRTMHPARFGSDSRRMRLGQHFLVSRSVAAQIADAAALNHTESVFEIGTGMGMLTRELCKRAHNVVSVEIDGNLADHARKLLLEFENLEIIKCNGLDAHMTHTDSPACSPGTYTIGNDDADCPVCDLDGTSAAAATILTSECNVFASNLPYSYSRAAVEQLASAGFERCIIMVQREFASKLLAGSAYSSYRASRADRRAISIIAQYCFEIKAVMQVPASCFEPRPSVDSVVIHMRRLRRLDPSVVAMVNCMFSYRRKSISAMLEMVCDSHNKCGGFHGADISDLRMLASAVAGRDIGSARIDDIDVRGIVRIAGALLEHTGRGWLG